MILNTFKIFSRISLIFILILFFTNYDNLLAKELFPVVDGGHVAYIDTAGNLVIDMELDTPYEEGTIEFEGKEYPTYIFPEWAYFSEGKTTYMMTWGWWFIRFGKNYGVIDTLGKIQLYPYSNIIWPFRNNLAKTSILLKSFDYIYGEKNTFVHYDDLQNLLDKDYYFKYPLFDYCGNFSEGFAVVLTFEYNEEGKKVNEGKFNYLGIDGKLITDKGNTINSKGENLDGFEDIRTFSEGMGVVQIDSLWGAVNSNGELVITPKYPILWEFHDGLARFFDGKFYGFINANGEKIFGQMFREASDFSDGYSKVILQENEYAYISTDYVGTKSNYWPPKDNW